MCCSAVDDLILCLCFVLVSKALNSTEQALLSGDEDRLYNALRSPALGLQSVQTQNKGWYLKQLLADREQKEQVKKKRINADFLQVQSILHLCYIKGNNNV